MGSPVIHWELWTNSLPQKAATGEEPCIILGTIAGR
jgi:hypothetical protein